MPENDPDKLKGPGGLTLRQIHEQVRKSVERDREAQNMNKPVVRERGHWQRLVRYLRDRKWPFIRGA
jgi:hypothetical protein